jgi:CRISPR-associated protein Cmr6
MNPRVPLNLDRLPPQAHKGLLLDRFIPVKAGSESTSYYAPLQAVAQVDSAFPAYKLAYERWVASAKSIEHGVRIKGRVRGRMALGLGIESVTEIGCRLHHTYGVPVIPASSLKGALRAAVAPPEASPELSKGAGFLFGTPDLRAFATVSDGWWIPEAGKSGLSVDIITSHHSSYYTGSSQAPPSDFDSPIPNHFLTISGSFAFLIHAPNESWKKFLEKVMRQLLGEQGLGAKRSSGYGRLDQLVLW